MNKREDVFQRALKRLELANKTAEQEEREESLIFMIADKMNENGLVFFYVDKEDTLAFATLRHTQIKH